MMIVITIWKREQWAASLHFWGGWAVFVLYPDWFNSLPKKRCTNGLPPLNCSSATKGRKNWSEGTACPPGICPMYPMASHIVTTEYDEIIVIWLLSLPNLLVWNPSSFHPSVDEIAFTWSRNSFCRGGREGEDRWVIKNGHRHTCQVPMQHLICWCYKLSICLFGSFFHMIWPIMVKPQKHF